MFLSLAKLNLQDASFFFSSAIKLVTWVLLSDELPKVAEYLIGVVVGVNII